MSTLSSFKRTIKRTSGRMQRIRGYRYVESGLCGKLVRVPVLKTLRSWAVFAPVMKDGGKDWQMDPGQKKQGTTPGRRWLRRSMRRATSEHQKRALHTHYTNLNSKGAK